MSGSMNSPQIDRPLNRANQFKSALLHIENIATLPLPGTALPGNIAFSPDNQWISYLYSENGTLVRQLYLLNIKTREVKKIEIPIQRAENESVIPLEVALRRERQRIHEIGITQYAWATHIQRLLIPLNGNLYVMDGVEYSPKLILNGQGKPILDPQMTPPRPGPAHG